MRGMTRLAGQALSMEGAGRSVLTYPALTHRGLPRVRSWLDPSRTRYFVGSEAPLQKPEFSGRNPPWFDMRCLKVPIQARLVRPQLRKPEKAGIKRVFCYVIRNAIIVLSRSLNKYFQVRKDLHNLLRRKPERPEHSDSWIHHLSFRADGLLCGLT